MDLGRLVGLSAAGVNTINNIITKHVPMTQFCFSIFHLFIVLILDRAVQHKRGLFRQENYWFCSQIQTILALEC